MSPKKDTDPATNPAPADLAAKAQAQLEEIKLGRVGHYSYQSTCQTAIVASVVGQRPLAVNLLVVDSDGDSEKRKGVVVSGPQDGQATFHLNRDCPWGR